MKVVENVRVWRLLSRVASWFAVRDRMDVVVEQSWMSVSRRVCVRGVLHARVMHAARCVAACLLQILPELLTIG